MRITILTTPRLSHSVEGVMAQQYAQRATACGRHLALGAVDIIEVSTRRAQDPEIEGQNLLSLWDRKSYLIVCDEKGKSFTSKDFAFKLSRHRDQGIRHISFVLGGANGLSSKVKEAAQESLAFGPQTWPHALARVMLAEQIYRGFSILANTPYHHGGEL